MPNIHAPRPEPGRHSPRSSARRPAVAGLLALGSILVAFGEAELAAQADRDGSGWSYYGGDLSFTRYAPLDQIDRSNAADLGVVWRRSGLDSSYREAFPELDPSAYLRSTPVLIDGVLYAPNAVGLVEAFDPGTGRTLWVQQPFEATLDEVRGRSSRGVHVWGQGADRRLIVTREPYLYALDPRTGSPVEDFGADGRVLLSPEGDERFRWSFGPLVVGNVIVVAGIIGSAGDSGEIKEATPEDVRGFDARTGELLWTFHVVPREGELGNDTWGDGSWEWSGDLGSWCCLSADPETGIVYVPLSAPTSAYYGGHRPGWNLFSNTLVALNAATGERVWHFQMVHHDLWEYDTVGPPALGEIVVDGRTIRAVIQPSKTGFVYVFDRRTGEPVWPIEERPVPQSDVPGEQSSPTQPIPTKPPPFGAQGVTEDDLIDFTPEIRARAREVASEFVWSSNLYQPPSLEDHPDGTRGTLSLPSSIGGANWEGGAFDPETGYLYIGSMTNPTVLGLVPGGERSDMDYIRGNARAQLAPGVSIVKPPWGRITAIDLKTGEHAWMVENGDTPDFVAERLEIDPALIPRTGKVSRAMLLVTRTLLFSGEGLTGGPVFRAHDKSTGEILAEIELPGTTTGLPMSYMHDGRQFVVVAVGQGGEPSELVALALPQ